MKVPRMILFPFPGRKKLRKTAAGKLVRVLTDARVDTVLDVGANIGQTRDMLRKGGYEGRIISFEPVPSAHEQLLESAKRDPNWTIAPRTAVGDAPGETTINVSEATDMSSILKPNDVLLETLPRTAVTESIATPVTTIDAEWETYVEPSFRVFVKIDTQGYERQVLEGAKGNLDKILGFHLELSLLPLYDGEETYLSYLNDLHAWGFEPYMMWENYFSRTHGRQMQLDVVFMHSDLHPPKP